MSAARPANDASATVGSPVKKVVNPYRVEPRKLTPKWMYATPLVFAPALPLIRLGLRKNPVLRNRVFGATLAVAFVHGVLLLSNSYAVAVDPRKGSR